MQHVESFNVMISMSSCVGCAGFQTLAIILLKQSSGLRTTLSFVPKIRSLGHKQQKTVQILHYVNFDFWLRCLSRWDQSHLSMLQGE